MPAVKRPSTPLASEYSVMGGPLPRWNFESYSSFFLLGWDLLIYLPLVPFFLIKVSKSCRFANSMYNKGFKSTLNVDHL